MAVPPHSRARGGKIAGRALALALLGVAAAAPPSPLVTLSIVGTSDLHGEAFPRSGAGGLPLLAGYLNNLRAARSADGGAVLLFDAGDTFQGNVASNLSEGAVVVDAYNAMRYTALAVGNHDFDFGSSDTPDGRQLPGDLRSALKARAVQARFPFLAANLLDAATGRAVEWANVRPSALVEAAGVQVGIVGVMTIDALRSTIAANVQGLRIAPLEPAVAAEAATLRAAGAEVVIAVAHAGGRCDRFDQPTDLSSCDQESEIFQLARSLPPGLVNVIVAGHTHAGLAHQVGAVGIIQPFSRGQSFGRVDLVFDRAAGNVARLQFFAPRRVCAWQDAAGGCAASGSAAAEYEGRPVAADPAIVQAMEPALERVRRMRDAPLGVSFDDGVRRVGGVGSPLGDLFAQALLGAVPGADVAAINNAGRLWADLPSGPITFGQLYDVFPFDNRLVKVGLTGDDLSRWVAGEIRQGRRGMLGIAGVEVQAGCGADGVHVELRRGSTPIGGGQRLLGVTIGAPTLNGNLASREFLGAVGPIDDSPVVREVVEDWFRRLGRAMPHERARAAGPRADDPDPRLAGCLAANVAR